MVVWICGSGGIGKTTIAKAVYSAIAHRFDGCCFLEDVRKNSEQHGGMVNLQNIILSSIVGHSELKINDVNEGSTLLSQQLRDKRFLLVVDDVDSLDQFKKIAGKTYLYGPGSRVIITTRDEDLFTARQKCQKYEALKLDCKEARELFCAHASVDDENLDNHESLIVGTVVEYAQGNPLALKVLGSYLCDTSVIKWPNMLDGSKQDPPKCIQDILTIGYDGLRDTVKEVFLDIACLYQGWKKNDTIQKLEGCGRTNVEDSIKVLEQKGLICVDNYGYISMPGMLQDMGKNIVQQESTEPGERSRLCHQKDAQDTLTKSTGTSIIEAIMVEEVFAEVKEPTYLDMPECQVGLVSRLGDMLKILDVEANDVRMVGIWGIGGVGKTTIAKAVYNEIAHKFDGCCFLADVRRGSQQYGGLVKLQKTILSQSLVDKILKVDNVHEGVDLLCRNFRDKRILLILDDVDKLDQLNTLAGAPYWFGNGSRVIITTRDKHLLTGHRVDSIYQACELDDHESRELFSSNAFKNKRNPDNDEKFLIDTLVNTAQGLPLALKILGAYLLDRPLHDWQAVLDGFKRNDRTREILKITYDGLEEREREVFLDIACFFKGWKRNKVIPILECCGHINPAYIIKVLEDKALICVDIYGLIRMHDLLEEMGKSIIQQESKEPGKRSRLWHHKDVQDILTRNTGTSKIKGIIVQMPTAVEIQLSPKCFKKMKNLKIFININGRFTGKVDYLPNQLRVLDWAEWPLQSLPSNFDMKKMIHLNMRGSRIAHLEKGFKSMQKLTSLNLGNCLFLTQFPDVSKFPKLEFLDLSYCTNLVEIHPSVGFLENLVELNLEGCCNLVRLPGKVTWRSLQELNLDHCSSLEGFPEIVGEMIYMTTLSLSDTAIKALPSSIRHLINLEKLSLVRCGNLTDLPCSIYELHKLKRVYVSESPTYSKVSHDDCDTSMDSDNLALPWLDDFSATKCNIYNIDFMRSLDCASTLQFLNLSGNHILILSECINEFVNLKTLDLSDCWRLVEISELPPRIEWLDVRNCVSLESISKLSNILERKESQMIEWMDLTNCWKLCQNLVEMAKEEDDEVVTDLFSRLLSSQQSNFTVIFPVPRCQVPGWFSCQMDFPGYDGSEFGIETLENFKWDNNTGLALCVAVDHRLHETDRVCFFDVIIHINEVNVLHLPSQYVDSEGSDHVWVHYVPFSELWRFGYMLPLPPFTCRVAILPCRDSEASIRSCGVHLVMPPNEDVCMKLIPAENRTSYGHSVNEIYKEENWKNYLPKQRTDCKPLCIWTNAI